MSKADEMFKSLGYVKYDNHPEEDEENDEDYFTTQDIRQIRYEQRNNDCVEKIIFIPSYKIVWVEAFKERCRIPAPLNAEEVRAINEKLKELGWI